MSARERILQLMQEFHIEPKKSLGQNFLISDHVIDKIVKRAQEFNPSVLVEVGPGLGSLTYELMKLKNVQLFQLIELDFKIAQYWKSKNQNVIEADALQWDWEFFLKSNSSQGTKILVSNLPYQISSSLVIDRCLDQTRLDAMILMFQKEVAQRMKAAVQSENYGMLSVMSQTFWNLETLLEASSGDFHPPPKVASRVLVFTKKNSIIQNPKDYLKFLKACFLHPRKMMISNLIEGLSFERAELTKKFEELGLSLKIRAQEVLLQQYIELYFSLGYK